MSTPNTTSTRLLTAADLADLLQVSVRTVWRLRSSASIPLPLRIRGSVRWNREEVERWLEQGCPMIGPPRRKG
jgi:prophage regulatory protein